MKATTTKLLASKLDVELRTKRSGLFWHRRSYVARVRIFTTSPVDAYRQSAIALHASDAVEGGYLMSPPIPMGIVRKSGFRFDVQFPRGPQSSAFVIRSAVYERVAIVPPR